MDYADLANEEVNNYVADSARTSTQQYQRECKLSPQGYCHNPDCCEDVEANKLFCHAACADRYEALRRLGHC